MLNAYLLCLELLVVTATVGGSVLHPNHRLEAHGFAWADPIVMTTSKMTSIKDDIQVVFLKFILFLLFLIFCFSL